MDAAYTGNQIARQRKALGMTQKELANKLHVTDKAVSKWERGINFPDLGIIETLAQALNTTPVSLLGLEQADQEEIVTSMAEVSGEQLEDARKDATRIGWGSLSLAAALVLVYHLFGRKDVPSRQQAYQLLHCVITVIAVFGVYLLVKYEQIRKFDVTDLFLFLAAGFSILVFLLHQLMTGLNPPLWLALLLIAVASCTIQMLFIRLMKPKFIKALPMTVTIAYALWRLWRGYGIFSFTLPAICCIIVWITCLVIEKRKSYTKTTI